MYVGWRGELKWWRNGDKCQVFGLRDTDFLTEVGNFWKANENTFVLAFMTLSGGGKYELGCAQHNRTVMQ